MDNQTNASQFAALEEAVASVIGAADEAAELLHVLAAVAGGLPDLQRALAEYRGAYPPKTVTGPALPVRASAPLSVATPAAGNSQVGNNEPDAGDGVALASNAVPALAAMRTVSVIVSRTDGPIDLVRVHSALDGLAGVRDVTLASYTRDRALLLLDTDRHPDALPLAGVLLAAFPEGVDGHWLGETDFVATIGAVTGATS